MEPNLLCLRHLTSSGWTGKPNKTMEFNTVKFAIWLLFILFFPIERILAIVTAVPEKFVRSGHCLLDWHWTIFDISSVFQIISYSSDWTLFCSLCCRRTHTCAVMNVMPPALTCLTHHSWWETGSGEVLLPIGNQSHGPSFLSHYWPTSLCHGTKVWR